MNTEIVFTIEQAPEGGWLARAAGQAIFVEAESVPELHDKVRDAVVCHFDAADAPKPIRLRFVRDEGHRGVKLLRSRLKSGPSSYRSTS